ncbi:hypothetical protein D4R99_01545 [bacterium]|nr:MAG: hypothetical protein D4R99_01545 [bacterium]
MEFAQDFITTQKLTPEQVTALKEVTDNHEADIKKTYDGKANTDAEAILEGAAKAVETKTGIARDKGQKIADYFIFAGGTYADGKLSSEKTTIQRKQQELDKMIQEGAGDTVLKKKNDELSTALDTLKKKEAEFDRVTTGNFEGLYTTLLGENKTLKQKTAFNSVKPTFSEAVNKYEAASKWKNFEDDILTKYDIELVDGEYMGISKDNKYKTAKLSDLVSKNEEIKGLLTGKKDLGTGTNLKGTVKVKDVPFEVPDKATHTEIQQAIRDYLVNELKLNHLSKEYSKQFSELNKKILEGTPA